MMEEKLLLLDRVKRDRSAFQFLPDHYRSDQDIALASIEAFGITLAFAPLAMKMDRQIALTAVKANGLAIEFVHPDIAKHDLEVCLAAVENDVDSVDLMDPGMRMNQEILLALLKKAYGTWEFKKYVPDELLAKEEFMKQVVSLDGRLLGLAPAHIYMNPEIAILAARNCGRFAFKRLKECFEIPELIEELEGMQTKCEALVDQFLIEQDSKKKEKLYWDIVRYESDFGIRSSRSGKFAFSDKDLVLENEPDGIRVFMMSDEHSVNKTVDSEGNDPMKIDAIFHTDNTSFGGFSYALALRLQESLHRGAQLVATPLINKSGDLSVYQQARAIMRDILHQCQVNNWHRIRLTNFTYLKSSQFETFLGIGDEISEQEDAHALCIYMDIDPAFVKGKFGDQLGLLEPK
jgi:hypothetical protein